MCGRLLRARACEQIERPQKDVPREWGVRRVTGDTFERIIKIKTRLDKAAIKVGIHGRRCARLAAFDRVEPLSRSHLSRIEKGCVNGVI